LKKERKKERERESEVIVAIGENNFKKVGHKI